MFLPGREIFKPCTFHGELRLIPWYSFATHSRTLKPDWTQWSVRLAVAWKLEATHGLNTWTFTHGANYYTLLFCAKPSTARSCETGLCVWLHPVLPISVSSDFLPNHTLGNILHTCKTCLWQYHFSCCSCIIVVFLQIALKNKFGWILQHCITSLGCNILGSDKTGPTNGLHPDVLSICVSSYCQQDHIFNCIPHTL